MYIVIEGPDNAGKSTLASKISLITHKPVLKSEGREKYPGEINERVIRWLEKGDRYIFDRHPVVSQLIYSVIRPNTPVDQKLVERFYLYKPLFIYCRPVDDRRMEGHIAKEYDSEDYLQDIATGYDRLLRAYDEWALRFAHIIYRMTDDESKILSIIHDLVKGEES